MAYNNRVRFCFRKGGVFYFVRRVPADLASVYKHTRISFSLRTKSRTVAQSRAMAVAARLEEHWFRLRLERDGPPVSLSVPVKSLFANQAALSEVTLSSTTLTQALETYLRLRGAGRSQLFRRTTERAVGYLITVCGDRPVAELTRRDANAFRDWLIAKGLTGSSVGRMLSCVRAVINVAANEEGIDSPRAFSSVQYDRKAGVVSRAPVPLVALRRVQTACVEADDDRRWLVALIADTGLRLSEAAGLARADLVLHHPEGAFVEVRPHDWRPLKTASSARRVPLVGSAEWAARRVLSKASRSAYAFPRYVSGDGVKANAASATLNKWLIPLVPEGCSIHGMRHALRDRLRTVECPSDIVDQIGGWTTAGAGHGYGKGYPLTVLRKWMEAMTNVT
ncbi:DUF6538 domain-containing protein [Chthonobacter rhizosphaerae]|uniref:DUF6538 domain-containing protein n=1 Tax=Chthonobacter rhizosphaerae TaxID=2735553 RepID=UPI0015EF8043